jgi:hypothetical protein
MRPSLFVGDFPLAYFSKKFCGDDIVCTKSTKHLEKGTAALSEGVQSLDMARKHWRALDDGIGHQAAIFRPLQNSPECHQLGEQDKGSSFSFEPLFALAISPVGPPLCAQLPK